jgi:hypothetical protein
MRYRALLACIFALIMPLIAGCNSTGIPDPVPSTATPPARPTATEVAIVDPEPEPTSTRASRNSTPTVRPRPTGTARAEATVTAGQVETPVPSGTVSAELQQLVEEIEQDAAEFRGLEPLADVPEAFLTEDQLRTNLTREMEADYPRDEAARDAKELWLMRLSEDPNLDLYQLYIDLQTEQVLGYYDQIKNELFVRNDGEELSPSARQTLAHEFVHALQDQHYDLEKMLPSETTDDDGALAIRAMVEGDATVAGILYAQAFMTPEEYQSMIDESANADTTVLDSAPRYIRDILYFPYTQGVDFVITLGILTGFEPVDEAFLDPPTSSEQIMHPEKYMDSPRDMPKPATLVPLTDTLGAGWTHGDNGTLGEFDLKIILEENGAVDGEGAAAGWGGGVYEYYASGDQALMMLNTVWDTRRDADEFEDALNETFTSYEEDGDILKDPDGRRFFSVKRNGTQITLGASNDSAALERAMGAVR